MRTRPSFLLLVVAVLVGLLAGPALAQDDVKKRDDRDVTVTIPPAPTPGPTPAPLPSTPVLSFPPDGSGDAEGTPGSGPRSSGGEGVAAPAETPAAGTSEPAIGAKPGRGDRLRLDRDYVMPGEVVVASAKGLTAGEMAQMVLFSDPVLIGNQAVDPEGAYQAEVTIPEDTEPGRHTLQLTGWASGKIYTGVLVVGDPASAADASGDGLPLWLWWIAAAVLLALLTGLGARAAWSVRRGAIATGAAS